MEAKMPPRYGEMLATDVPGLALPFGMSGINTVFQVRDSRAMLRVLYAHFPDGIADGMNLAVFSTGGISGSYQTLEDAWAMFRGPGQIVCPECDGATTVCDGDNEDGTPGADNVTCEQCGGSGIGDGHPTVTCTILRPCQHIEIYGECAILDEEDFEYLKRLRESSWGVFCTIGAPVVDNNVCRIEAAEGAPRVCDCGFGQCRKGLIL